MTIFEETVYLCGACKKRSGDGLLVQISYNNTGGYSPTWEGRLCEHLTVADIMPYLRSRGLL